MTPEALNRVRTMYAEMDKATGAEYAKLSGDLVAVRMGLMQALYTGLKDKQEYKIMRDLYAYNCSVSYVRKLYGLNIFQFWRTVRRATKKLCG